REVIPSLIAAVGALDRYGQLSAIEVLEHCQDADAGPALIELLSSSHETVREWSAWALAELGVREAVPQLRETYRRHRTSGAPPNGTEAVAIRHADCPWLPRIRASTADGVAADAGRKPEAGLALGEPCRCHQRLGQPRTGSAVLHALVRYGSRH